MAKLANEEQLIREAQADQSKFSLLYRHYFEQIYYFLLAKIRNEADAEDLTAITFAKALNNLKKYKEGNFRAWLYRIANNSFLDFVRKENRISHDEDQMMNLEDTHSEDASETVDKAIMLDKVKSVMKTLPEKYQNVLSLKYFSDMSNGEIAEMLNCRENSVAVQLHRGVKMLTELLNNN
ncbi:MAG TPA: RNA polymerase sigma factor [bacterium]|nr:RNA polymerase sigma factor [bacterium]